MTYDISCTLEHQETPTWMNHLQLSVFSTSLTAAEKKKSSQAGKTLTGRKFPTRWSRGLKDGAGEERPDPDTDMTFPETRQFFLQHALKECRSRAETFKGETRKQIKRVKSAAILVLSHVVSSFPCSPG